MLANSWPHSLELHLRTESIITSYLPKCFTFLQTFLKSAITERDRRRRIVDLIRDAAPIAAVRADRARYEKFLDDIIRKAS